MAMTQLIKEKRQNRDTPLFKKLIGCCFGTSHAPWPMGPPSVNQHGLGLIKPSQPILPSDDGGREKRGGWSQIENRQRCE